MAIIQQYSNLKPKKNPNNQRPNEHQQTGQQGKLDDNCILKRKPTVNAKQFLSYTKQLNVQYWKKIIAS